MAGTLQSSPSYGLTPAPQKVTLASNYLGSSSFSFLNQFLPDTYEKEFERYGNRSIASFLRQVSAEIPTNSDMIKWAEQGRLHVKYTGLTVAALSAANGTQVFTNPLGTMAYRVGQTVFLSSTNGLSRKALITTVTASTFTVVYYGLMPVDIFIGSTVTSFVYGSEFVKGSAGMSGSVESQDVFFDKKPIILKGTYQVSGSDMAQIGWVEITDEEGGTGYLWYMKSNHEERLRFEDTLEMAMVEGEPAIATSGAYLQLSPAASTTFAGGAAASTTAGTKGLFYEVTNRGNVWSAGNPNTLSDWDVILQRLDKQGSIQENVIFMNRQFSLDTDDMLSSQNSYGANGTSFGLFNNDKDMALNLGFTGFRRGSYDMYKNDWKYLNDATLRGDIVAGAVNGILVPAGTMSVYDQVLGKTLKRPFLHIRYRASEVEDRKLKTWVTGGAGGASTSSDDYMQVNYLSERCLCVLGANNFMIFNN